MPDKKQPISTPRPSEQIAPSSIVKNTVAAFLVATLATFACADGLDINIDTNHALGFAKGQTSFSEGETKAPTGRQDARGWPGYNETTVEGEAGFDRVVAYHTSDHHGLHGRVTVAQRSRGVYCHIDAKVWQAEGD